jgi:hypothetical protein
MLKYIVPFLRRREFLVPIASICLSAGIAVPAFGEESCKKIFDGTLYLGKPDLAKSGLQRAIVTDPLRWWKHGESLDELTRGDGPEDWVRSRVGGEVLALDNERWATAGSKAVVTATVQKLGAVVKRLKTAGFTKPIGYYGIPPNRDYWRAVKEPSSKEYKAWQAENDLLAPLMGDVDALFPSLYTFYDDAIGWQKFAVANLNEARRVSRGKPVYAFLWPEYHDSNKKLQGKYLSAQFWTTELETSLQYADGVVIWGGWQQRWDDKAPWWLATKKVLAASPALCPTLATPRTPGNVVAN